MNPIYLTFTISREIYIPEWFDTNACAKPQLVNNEHPLIQEIFQGFIPQLELSSFRYRIEFVVSKIELNQIVELITRLNYYYEQKKGIKAIAQISGEF